MSSTAILDTARAHFDNMRGKTIEIPEWGDQQAGTPLVAKYDPPTLRVRQQIKSRSGQSDARQMAVTVILCLKDEAGKPIFEDDAPTLVALEAEVDPKIVARVANTILGLTAEPDLGN